jgi:hypothetical protein
VDLNFVVTGVYLSLQSSKKPGQDRKIYMPHVNYFLHKVTYFLHGDGIMIIAKPEWFTIRKYTSWGVDIRTWQGAVYIAGMCITLPILLLLFSCPPKL